MIKVTVTNNGDFDIKIKHEIPGAPVPAVPVIVNLHVGESVEFDADTMMDIKIKEVTP